jgi:hypothetical protein
MSNATNTPRRKYVTVCQSIDVDIDDKPYKLLEMKGPELTIWTNFSAGRAKFVDGEMVGFNPMESIQAKLISLCAYDENGKPVPEEVIRGWPATTQKGLFEDCQKLNGLDDDSREEEKKS